MIRFNVLATVPVSTSVSIDIIAER